MWVEKYFRGLEDCEHVAPYTGIIARVFRAQDAGLDFHLIPATQSTECFKRSNGKWDLSNERLVRVCPGKKNRMLGIYAVVCEVVCDLRNELAIVFRRVGAAQNCV